MHPPQLVAEFGGQEEGTTGVDDDFARRGFENIGAWIMGRNMFGPIRGAWPDDAWKGWWGNNPPYHVPVFVLTHHPRKSEKETAGASKAVRGAGVEIRAPPWGTLLPWPPLPWVVAPSAAAPILPPW